jgi:hypothetical protein
MRKLSSLDRTRWLELISTLERLKIVPYEQTIMIKLGIIFDD